MHKLMEEWRDYKRIISEHLAINYTVVSTINIPPKKESRGGCCQINNHLFGIANSSRDILDIDCKKRSYETFGYVKIGTFKWTGCCLYQEKIYGFPRKENSILIIDPLHREVLEKRLNIQYRGEHHYGGICTTEGMLYQPPRNTNHILCTDLNTFETKEIQMFEQGVKARYSSSVQHPNGAIYMIPEYGFQVAVLHTETEEIRYLGEPFTHLVFGVVVGYDGNIYGYSKEGKGLLKITVEENRIEWICEEIGEPDCYGAVVGINGKIYGVPASGKYIWEFDIERQQAVKLYEVEETGYAYNAGGGIGTDGTICMMPCFGNTIYFLQTNQVIQLDEDSMNNRFFNTMF